MLYAITKTAFLEKGIDIETEEGLTMAAEFLKNATWEDAFTSDVAILFGMDIVGK